MPKTVTAVLERFGGTPSRRLLSVLLAWLGGLAARCLLDRPTSWAVWLVVATVGVMTAVILSGAGRRFWFSLLLLACFVLGFWRYDVAWRGSAFAQLPVDLPAEAEFVGSVVSEPRERADGLVVLDMQARLSVDTGLAGELARLYLKTPLHYRYGDRLSWSCRPRVVVPAEAVGFERRLLLDGVRWNCSVYASPEILQEGQSTGWRGRLSELKRGVTGATGRVLPEPESSFLLGLLIGLRDGLPADLAEGFRLAGLSHILAVSGYNVVQLIGIGSMLLGLVLLPRRRAVVVMAAVVVGFAALVGSDASVIRAAVMGCVGLLAVLLRRRYDGTRAILLTAAVMLLLNPLVLRYDLGFQLSFAAVWGLHGLAPGLLELLPGPWQRRALVRTAVETSAATLATLPIVLQSFSRLPAVVLLANLVVLPLLPWAMLFGLLALLLGVFSQPLGLVPAAVAAWLLRIVEWLTVGSVRLVPQALELEIGPWTVLSLYFWLGLLAWSLSQRKRVLCRGG